MLIKSFGLISGYTINFDKSNVLHLTNCPNPPWRNLYPFILCKDKLFYLGISIPKIPYNLYKTNISSLLSFKDTAATWILFNIPFKDRKHSDFKYTESTGCSENKFEAVGKQQ